MIERHKVAGWRLSDAAAIYEIHNRACSACAPNDTDHRSIRRRLLLLADMIKTTALSCYGDVEGEALAEVEDFWARRKAGQR